MHCTMTAILSDMIVLTIDVSLTMREVRNPTPFSGFSNQPSSFRRTAALHQKMVRFLTMRVFNVNSWELLR
jgi:hypothetical protein